MAQIILLNKPFNVLCQFSDNAERSTLADYVNTAESKGYYPAGRLDYDSEGLVILTNDGQLQHRITDPKSKMEKTYWVQVEGNITEDAILSLQKGVNLKDGRTLPAQATTLSSPNIWERNPPIRERQNIATSWLELKICEGKNRQVRRMTAAVGYPTLRLIRVAIGPWRLNELSPGQFTTAEVNLPKRIISRPHKNKHANKHHQRR
ncbi:Ribosomal large subunit pseudouridine synthase E [Thalassocella blandensis]|nr:Ribosomal large subunit pseudouridine synthase E [Thalassocella blandensis]